MARLELMGEDERKHLLALPCPTYDQTPSVSGPPLSQRKVAIISTAGLHKKGDRPFDVGASDYRLIPSDIDAKSLVLSHISTNFDRTGFQQDWNVMFPLDRLNDLVHEGIVGSVATYHFSLMGATDPRDMESTAIEIANIMKKDGVNGVLLVPV